jgi:hypothetical protein
MVYGCLFTSCRLVAQSQAENTNSRIIKVTTALNHLTVLEFQEPVNLVVAGGSDFQIERQENKVFVKPLRSGIATNLFVWTATQRFNYELEPAGEVKNMNFAIDNATVVKAPADTQTQLDEVADMMLTRTFLGSESIDNSSVISGKERVSARVEQIFRTKNSLYVHYRIENKSKTSYPMSAPAAYRLQVGHPKISLQGLQGRQLDQQTLKKLQDTKEVALPIAHADVSSENLSAGQTAHGVVAIRQTPDSPVVLELVFAGGIKSIVVL